jgi:hypothetical protein
MGKRHLSWMPRDFYHDGWNCDREPSYRETPRVSTFVFDESTEVSAEVLSIELMAELQIFHGTFGGCCPTTYI